MKNTKMIIESFDEFINTKIKDQDYTGMESPEDLEDVVLGAPSYDEDIIDFMATPEEEEDYDDDYGDDDYYEGEEEEEEDYDDEDDY
jgi:DNA-directed RNA polymerase subunit delta